MTASEIEHQFVVFALHGERYALPVAAVREITRYTPPSATAAAGGLVRGMINLRGRVLPVVDLSVRLGQELEVGTGTRILVVELANGTVGLIVDGVDGVTAVPPEQIEPLPVPVGEDGLGEQIAVVGERLVILLDPDRALGSALGVKPKRRRRATATTARRTPAKSRATPPPPGSNGDAGG